MVGWRLGWKAVEKTTHDRAEIKDLLVKNIEAEKTDTDPALLADLISTFFSGLCMEQYLAGKRRVTEREIEALMRAMRAS